MEHQYKFAFSPILLPFHILRLCNCILRPCRLDCIVHSKKATPFSNFFHDVFCYHCFKKQLSKKQIVCTVTFEKPHVLCVDTGRSSETAKAHRG
eukprot:TRINITY_DN3451_c0_g1_i1.p1 TRINITY_DN3451_c0_g1~~TRINITY_DN3451_c0_g1_i1.p1  ORF type:complete len:94 (+),score=17.56 TRINITY_DN3451_c0_g1_i1:19-300(+)